MRSENRTWWQYALVFTLASSNVPRPGTIRQARSFGFLLSALLALGMCGVGSARADGGTPQPQLSQRVDPGPKPRIEDYTDMHEYLLALIRWLYAVNGGDPADLDRTSMQKAADRVAHSFSDGLATLEAVERSEELLQASASIAQLALSSKLTIWERLSLLELVASINAAVGVVEQSQ